MLVPVGVLAAVELALRVMGLGAADPWENPYVTFEEIPVFFPDWEAKVRMPKASSLFRIFALGGSTTWGFSVREPYPALLQQGLAERFPARRWEVINGGLPAYGSYRVFEVLKRASQFDPDLVVVYMGNNEFLEEIFFDPGGIAAKVGRAARLARRLHLVNYLRKPLGRVLPEWRPKLQRHYLGRSKFPLIRSPRQYNARLELLASSVGQMIDYCNAQGSRIVFIPAVPNLLWRPGNPVHGPGYAARPERWSDLFARAETRVHHLLFRQGRTTTSPSASADAVQACQEACQIDDQYALSHYYLGLAWLAAGEWEKARDALLLANQHDKRGDRANPDVFQTILAVCRRKKAAVLDLRPRIFRALPQEFERFRRGRSRTRLFLDFCHPSREGHALIADALLAFLIDESLLTSVSARPR